MTSRFPSWILLSQEDPWLRLAALFLAGGIIVLVLVETGLVKP
jgi:hypothetical protein